MKTAAIAIDSWKLPVFTKMLKKAGYQFTKAKGLTDDTLFLKVETEDLEKLKDLVIRMNTAAALQNVTVH